MKRPGPSAPPTPQDDTTLGDLTKRQSCNDCRDRKRKCDGQASCENCQKRGIPCVYESPRARGVPIGYRRRPRDDDKGIHGRVQRMFSGENRAEKDDGGDTGKGAHPNGVKQEEDEAQGMDQDENGDGDGEQEQDEEQEQEQEQEEYTRDADHDHSMENLLQYHQLWRKP